MTQDINFNRRRFLFGAVSVSALVAVAASIPGSPAFAQAAEKWEQLIATTVTNAKSRLAVVAANDNIFASNDNTIIKAVATDIRASAGSPILRALGKIGGAVGIGMTIYMGYKYVTTASSTIKEQSIDNVEPAGIDTVFQMVDYWNAHGAFTHQGYGFTVGLGGSRAGSKFPQLDAATAATWNIFWTDTNGAYQTGDQFLFVAQTNKKIVATSAQNFAEIANFLPSKDISAAELQSALASDTNPALVSEVKQAVLTALKPYFPASYPPIADDVPDLGMTPADLSSTVTNTALASVIDNSDSSTSTPSSSSPDEGTISFPGLPEIPPPADWFNAWKSQLNPLLPKIPVHAGVCTPISLQLPDQVYPALTTKAVSFSQFCPVVDQLKPTLRTWATILSAIGAFMIILKA